MTIAIDIDGTWDRDPWLFSDFAETAAALGHEVIIVTGRPQPEGKLKRIFLRGDFLERQLPIIVAGPKLKEQAARDAGYKVDVWIDDMPGAIQECTILNTDGGGVV